MANSDCKNILNLIPLYIDNMLSDEEKDIVSRHLDCCCNCKKEFEFIKSIVVTSKDIPQVDLPQDFHKNLIIKAENAARAKKAKRYLMLRRIGAGVATAAVVALSVVTFTDLNITQKAQNPDQYVTPNVSDTPFSFIAPNRVTDDSHIENDKTSLNSDVIKTSKAKESEPADSYVNHKDVNILNDNEDAVSAELSVVTEADEYTIATVTVSDENRGEVLELLLHYEKDDVGYIIPDIEKALEELKKLEADIEITTTDTISQNYVVLK